MSDPLCTDQKLGEGFAYFRWHCFRWPHITNCTGWNDAFSYCAGDWRVGDRG